MGATTVLSNGTLLVDDELRNEAAEIVETAHDRTIVGVSLTLDDGSHVQMPDEMASFVSHVLHGLSRGAINVVNFPPELTSTTAAEILGVSRPTLMKWVQEGSLSPRRVGSHHRFDTDAVIDFAHSRRAERTAAFDALRAWDESNEE